MLGKRAAWPVSGIRHFARFGIDERVDSARPWPRLSRPPETWPTPVFGNARLEELTLEPLERAARTPAPIARELSCPAATG